MESHNSHGVEHGTCNFAEERQTKLSASEPEKAGVERGAEISKHETEDGVELVAKDRIHDIARGSLAEFARYRNPDAAEERAWVASHIAESADEYA